MALLYAGEAEYLDAVVDFLRPAVESDEPIALAVGGSRARAIQRRVGDRVELRLLDPGEMARNPGRIIPAVLTMLEAHAGRRLHVVGECVWPGRSADEIQETVRHEALINLAWPGAALRVGCTYDTAALDPTVIRDARRTHPWLMENGAVQRSDAYLGAAFPAGADDPLPDPPADARAMTFGAAELAGVRALVSEAADRAGLAPKARGDLVLAVNEVATNAVKYGPEEGRLVRVWSEDGRVVCQLEDRGHIADPLAGRRRPVPGVQGGLGLWMVNQLCDLVQTRTTPSGTTIRLHAHLR